MDDRKRLKFISKMIKQLEYDAVIRFGECISRYLNELVEDDFINDLVADFQIYFDAYKEHIKPENEIEAD